MVEEELHQGAIPGEQDLHKRNRLNACAVGDEHFDHVQPLLVHGIGKCAILLFLAGFVSCEQFDKAVKTEVDRRSQRRFFVAGEVQIDLPDAIQRSTS